MTWADRRYEHIAAAFDPHAPACRLCGERTRFLLKLGGSILWDCHCGAQISKPIRKFNQRITEERNAQADQNLPEN